MWRYLIQRLLWVVLVLLFITLITYLIFLVMPPADPAQIFAGKHPTPEIIAQVRPSGLIFRYSSGLSRSMDLKPIFLASVARVSSGILL